MKQRLIVTMEVELEIKESATMSFSEIKKEMLTSIKRGSCGVHSGQYNWEGFKNVKILPKGYILKK